MDIGFALTGSFCTINKVLDVVKTLSESYNIFPICSETVACTDTRFIKATDTIKMLEDITGNKVIDSIKKAEPIGPKKLFDALIIAPCTGNTIGKIANGITDTSVLMAAKAHLRNNRPVILAISTNDGLSGSAENIGKLLNRKNIFFVPYGQDDYKNKNRSLVADFDKIEQTLLKAIKGEQIQPMLY